MAAIAKCLLILINTLFMMIGLALAAVGVILVFFPGEVLGDVYDSVKDSVSNPAYALPDSADAISDVPFINTLGIGLLAFGAFLFVLSFLAYMGACCTTCCKYLLIVYAIIVIVLVIAQIVLGTMFFISDSPLHENSKDELKDMITNDYQDDGTDAFSMSLNLVHQYFDCCGIESNLDFGAKQYRSCDAVNYQTGCYSKLQNVVDDNIVWCGVGLGLLCLLQLIQVYFAISIYKDNKIGPV